MSLDEERKTLISALEEAVKLDKEKFRGRGLLSTPDKAVLQKVREAIEACELVQGDCRSRCLYRRKRTGSYCRFAGIQPL